mgnify:CR=1 FL=1
MCRDVPSALGYITAMFGKFRFEHGYPSGTPDNPWAAQFRRHAGGHSGGAGVARLFADERRFRQGQTDPG